MTFNSSYFVLFTLLLTVELLIGTCMHDENIAIFSPGEVIRHATFAFSLTDTGE